MKIKLCGLRRRQDIEYINEFKPDYAGFILSDGFKRSVDEEKFHELEAALDKNIKRTGVFVNEPIERVIGKFADKLDVIQLHGDEDIHYIQKLKKNVKCSIWKAVRAKASADIKNAMKLNADMLLLDAFVPDSYGGTGKTIDPDIIKNAGLKRDFFLAGGLNCENIKKIINQIHPYGVDISSGTETDGVKDRKKIKMIIEIIRSCV